MIYEAIHDCASGIQRPNIYNFTYAPGSSSSPAFMSLDRYLIPFNGIVVDNIVTDRFSCLTHCPECSPCAQHPAQSDQPLCPQLHPTLPTPRLPFESIYH